MTLEVSCHSIPDSLLLAKLFLFFDFHVVLNIQYAQ